MGLLLKIAIFAVAAYTVWSTARRWLGSANSLGRRPSETVERGQSARSRPPAVEDTRQCTVCGNFVPPSAARCGRTGCPQP
jgi:hypothetical protein